MSNGATPLSGHNSISLEELDRLSKIPEAINQTDLGNARRLVARHGQNIRYVSAWGVYLVWSGTHYKKDETGEVQRLARETVASIYQEAARAADTEERKSLAKWALASESRSRLENMVALAKDEPGVAIRHTDLDANPWLLNCRNGTIDLRTGELRAHRREDLITKRIEVDYDPAAKCPTFLKFIDRITGGDRTRATFLQRAAGYTLTGVVSEQCLFFPYGIGANGKSTFIEALLRLLGPYALKAPTEMLMAKQYGGAVPNDIARLPGIRMVVSAEVEEGRRMAESTVKDLTGGDTLVARFMRQEFFEFNPTHKLWMYGNHKPVIRGTDEGIWRRIHLIPFDVRIPTKERDPYLIDKLLAESPGILAWMVQGCLDWQHEGLGVPETVKAATASYRNEMDVIGAFIEECCIIDSNAKVKSGELYKAYSDWCEANGEHALNQRRFGMQLSERGFEAGRGTGNKPIRHGIGLLDTRQDVPSTTSDLSTQQSDPGSYPEDYPSYPSYHEVSIAKENTEVRDPYREQGNSGNSGNSNEMEYGSAS